MMEESNAEKLLQEEGFELVSPGVDRGAHSVVYRCRVARPPPHLQLAASASSRLRREQIARVTRQHSSGRESEGTPSSSSASSVSSSSSTSPAPRSPRADRVDPLQEDKNEKRQSEEKSESDEHLSRSDDGSSSPGGEECEEEEREEGQSGQLEVGQLVRIKVLNISLPLPRHLSNFHHEHQIVSETLAGVEGIVRVFARLSRPGLEALVLEDFGGMSLDKWLEHEGPFAARGWEGIDELLNLSLAVARTLGRIHSRSVVHKDIKPHNIIWNRQEGTVKITDFGISSVVIRSKDTTSSTQTMGHNKSVHHILGSLAYLPPELSLRSSVSTSLSAGETSNPDSSSMAGRPVDYRSDFYSLGITLYELARGAPPFHERSAMRMMHAHMAKQPPLIHELDSRIPRCLSNVINRLLAKSVEARYQSSRRLVSDLVQCQSIIAGYRRVDDLVSAGADEAEVNAARAEALKADESFVPGQDDVSDVFAFPGKLYGREEEIAKLQHIYRMFSSAGSNKSQVLMVAGYSGVGKTSLVNQLKEVKHQSYFMGGKYDFNKRDVPYSAIVAAFTDIIHQFLGEDEEQVTKMRDRLREAVGQHGKLLTYVIPSLELLIGEQPPVELDLGMSEMQNLYNQLFTRLIDALTSVKQGQSLIMFLDDLQWADQPSLQLIQKIVCRVPSPGCGPLLVVGVYRDNEVTSPTHPLTMLLEELRNKGVTCHSIHLQTLELEDVNKLVADVVHYNSDDQETRKLSELVFAKTKGNPFFTISFLTKLYQTELIWFDYNHGCWHWDLQKIEGMQYTDNVVEFMAQDLHNLPPETLGLLEVAAYFGGRFDARDIAEYVAMAVETVESLLWPSLRQGFVMRSGDYEYRFLHDRMQQAAFECVDSSRKKQLHLDVAQFMLTRIQVNDESANPLISSNTMKQETASVQHRFDIFDVVHHFSEAADLITDPEKRLQIARLNLQAAVKGKNSMAYEMARKVAAQGIAMLPEDCWGSNHNLTFQLYLERAQCEYLSKNIEVAEQLFEMVMAHAKDNWELSEVYIQRNSMSTCLQRYHDMIRYGLQGLAALGLEMPENPDDDMIAQAMDEVKQALKGRSVRDLLQNPPATDERAQTMQKLISKMGVGYYFINPKAYTYALATGVKISIQYGHVAHTTLIYIWFAWIACAIPKRFAEAYEWGNLAIELCEKHYAQSRFADRGEVWEIFYSYINWLKHPLLESVHGLEMGFKHAVAGGNPAFGTGCAYNLVGTFWYAVPLPQLVSSVGPYKRYSEETGWEDVYKMLFTFERYSKLLMDMAVEEPEDQFEAYIETNAALMPITQHHTVKMHYLYIMGRYQEALRSGRKALENIKYISQFKEEVEFYFAYSLTLLALCKASQSFVTPKERFRELVKDCDWHRQEKDMIKTVSGMTRGRAQDKRRRRRGIEEALDMSSTDILAIEAPLLSREEYESFKATVAENQSKLKQWADCAPGNFYHQYLLIEAERAWLAERERVGGRESSRLAELLEMYEKAFAHAIQNGFVQDAALAKELSWQLLRAMADQAAAESRYCFSKWGARAVVRQRDTMKMASSKDSRAKSPPTSAPSRSLASVSTNKNPYSTTTIITSALDLDALVQATQFLSSQLKISDLLTSLMDLIIVNTGATYGALLLVEEENSTSSSDSSKNSDSDEGNRQGGLYVRARAKTTSRGQVRVKVLKTAFNGDNIEVPVRIVNYCWRTRHVVLAPDILVDKRFESDEYIMRKQPRSILSVLIIVKDLQRGLVYLEHGQTAGMFSEDRLRLVKILTSQLMNTLENALLVERLRNANRELRFKNSQLREVDKMKDSFLAVASHELRTPLNGIMGMATLMEDTKMSAAQKECVEDIQASSETLLSLVNDVLDLSKIKAIKVKLENQVCGLAKSIESCLRAVEVQSASKGVNLAYIIDPSVPRYILTDRWRLQQIILNLLTHSLNLTESGDVIIHVSCKEADTTSTASSSSPPNTQPTRRALPSPAPTNLSSSSSASRQSPESEPQHEEPGSAGGSSVEPIVYASARSLAAATGLLTNGIARRSSREGTGPRNLPAGPYSPVIAEPGVASHQPIDRTSANDAEKHPANVESPLLTSASGGIQLAFRVQNSAQVVHGSDEELAQLFQPFSYGNAVHAFQYGGSGLGLYICKKLCKLMGGKLWAERDNEGEEESGFSFHFNIRVQEAELPKSERRTEWKSVFHMRRFLVCVISPVHSRILKDLFTAAGAEVVVATTKNKFMGKLEGKGNERGSSLRHRFDAVFMDWARWKEIEIFMLSLSHLPPLVLLASTAERESEGVKQLDAQYTPLHLTHLPLRQTRLIEEMRDVLECFRQGRSTSEHTRRDRTKDDEEADSINRMVPVRQDRQSRVSTLAQV